MSKLVQAHIALFIVNVIYGANYIVAKGVMPDHVGPSGFILMRVSGAVALFWLVKSFVKEKVARKDFLRLALCGLFGVAINQLLFFNGLNLTSPINSAIIMTSNPIMVLLLAAIIIKERITLQKMIGIVVGAGGAIALILGNSDTGLSSQEGDLYILINSLSYGVYLVIVKPLMSKYQPLTVISWVFFFGLLFVTPFGLNQLMEVEWSALPTDIVWAIFYVVVATTFLAYLLNIYALKTVNPSVSSSYIYLQPVMASAFALLHAALSTVGETNYAADITWAKGGYTLLIFLGVFLISKPIKRKNTAALK